MSSAISIGSCALLDACASNAPYAPMQLVAPSGSSVGKPLAINLRIAVVILFQYIKNLCHNVVNVFNGLITKAVYSGMRLQRYKKILETAKYFDNYFYQILFLRVPLQGKENVTSSNQNCNFLPLKITFL